MFAAIGVMEANAQNWNEWFTRGAQSEPLETTEEGYAKVSVNDNCIYEWDAEFCNVFHGMKGQQTGSRFTLTFDVKWVGEPADTASFYILTGAILNYAHADWQWTAYGDGGEDTEGSNTELIYVDEKGNVTSFWSGHNKKFQVANNQWTTVTWGGVIGKKGADWVGIQINLYDKKHTGVFYFANVRAQFGSNTNLFFSSHIFNVNNGCTIDKLKYSLSTNGEAILYGNELDENVKSVAVPSSIVVDSVEYTVTTINDLAFSNCGSLMSVSIPNTVTTIGNSAFKDCVNLTIYCQAKVKHSNWDKDWNINGCPVVWGSNLYTVTVKTDNNEHGTVYGSGSYADGMVATISATPAIGYHFYGWSDDNNDNPRTITVNEDLTFTAVFRSDESSSIADSLNIGYNNGYKDGYGNGYQDGLVEAKGGVGNTVAKKGDENYNNGYNDGYKDGYKEGFKAGSTQTSVTESFVSAINIYAYGKTIVVENAIDEIRVYDAMGKLICRDVACRARAEITISNTGLYIVKAGGTVQRVMIK